MKGRQSIRLLALCGTVLMAIMFYGVLIEPHLPDVHHVTIRDEHLAEMMGDLTVVHLSDLHINRAGRREKKVIEHVARINPDLIFLTGDCVARDSDYDAALVFLSRLQASVGIYGVMGEYDHGNSRKSCLFCHEKGSGEFTKQHGVRFLRDVCETVQLPRGSIPVCGVDYRSGKRTLSLRGLTGTNVPGPVIVLSHNPLVFDIFGKDRDVIMFAGDTHGGQVPLPAFIWRLLGYDENARYEQGLFVDGLKKMYVTRGIGTSHMPIRLFRRPEIVVYHFEK